MAIAGKPNSLYVLDSIKADLKAISRTADEPFWTDVAKVEVPVFFWNDEQAIYAAVGDAPALFLWVVEKAEGRRTSNQLGGELRPSLTVRIVGVCKRQEAVQEYAMELAEDVTRVMELNQSRKHPSSSETSTYATLTYLVEPFAFWVEQASKAGPPIGAFTCVWGVDYRFPVPKG